MFAAPGPLLSRIHATPHRMVMNFAGAGSLALAWLHSVGGSSRTVLEATDRYASASLTGAVGFVPERFTSERVARRLALAAYRRARALEPAPPLFGLGCTATIATDRHKRGEHRVAVAVHDALGSISYQLGLDKGERSRSEEEDLVSRVILQAVAEACGLQADLELPLTEDETLEVSYEPVPELERLHRGEVGWVQLEPGGTRWSGSVLRGLALLSGSFNPLHDGHRRLAAVAAERLGQNVLFELSLANADKPPIDLRELRRRALQFAAYAPLVLTRAPRFSDKAERFPGSTFVLGADTAARLVAPRFYGGEAGRDAALGELERAGTRFLVAGRSSKGVFRTLDDLAIPPAASAMFSAIPESAFSMDISSSELRARAARQT